MNSIVRIQKRKEVRTVFRVRAGLTASDTIRITCICKIVAVIVYKIIAGISQRMFKVAGEAVRIIIITITGAKRYPVFISVNVCRGLPAVTVGVLAVTYFRGPGIYVSSLSSQSGVPHMPATSNPSPSASVIAGQFTAFGSAQSFSPLQSLSLPSVQSSGHRDRPCCPYHYSLFHRSRKR